MTSAPLIVISPERQQRELERALAEAQAARAEHRRLQKLVALCYTWGVLGLVLIGWSFHLTDFDRAQAALLAGILLLIGGPSWTLILSHWLEMQGA